MYKAFDDHKYILHINTRTHTCILYKTITGHRNNRSNNKFETNKIDTNIIEYRKQKRGILHKNLIALIQDYYCIRGNLQLECRPCYSW